MRRPLSSSSLRRLSTKTVRVETVHWNNIFVQADSAPNLRPVDSDKHDGGFRDKMFFL